MNASAEILARLCEIVRASVRAPALPAGWIPIQQSWDGGWYCIEPTGDVVHRAVDDGTVERVQTTWLRTAMLGVLSRRFPLATLLLPHGHAQVCQGCAGFGHPTSLSPTDRRHLPPEFRDGVTCSCGGLGWRLVGEDPTAP